MRTFNLTDTGEKILVIAIIIIIIKIIYFLTLHARISSIERETNNTNQILIEQNTKIDSTYIKQNDLIILSQKNQEQLIEYLNTQNKLLERIANALEQDTEPYVIEKKETDT